MTYETEVIRMKKAAGLSWLVILFLICSLGCGERPFKLRLKFKPGDVYKYKVTQDSATVTEFMGKKMEMPSKTEVTLTQKVDRVEKGVAEITITCDSYDMEMNIGGRKIPNTMGSSMVGKQTPMKLGENGEVIEPKGLQSMVALQGLGGTDINNVLFSLYPKFPEQKLKVGDTWTQKEELPQSQMKVTVESKYTFTKREEKNGHPCAVLDYTISMNVQGGDESDMKMKGTGTGAGKTYVAYEKGLLVESKVDMDLKMSIAAPLPMGEQEIPTTTHQTIVLALIP
jgi:hypothetical protein